jgi:hypothetical protein
LHRSVVDAPIGGVDIERAGMIEDLKKDVLVVGPSSISEPFV